MAIGFANLGASATPDFASQTAATSFATASWAPPTSGLILLSINSVKVGGSDLPTVSGNSLTWVEIKTHLNGNWRLTLFAANASGATTGATTISYGGNSQLRCIASFSQATGVDLAGGVAAAFVQSVSETDASTSAPSITMAAAGHADNRPYAAFSNGVNQTLITPRTNWTELDEFELGDGGMLETQFRSDAFETTASASGPTTNWEIIAVELAEAGGAGHTKTLTDPLGITDTVAVALRRTISDALGIQDGEVATYADDRFTYADALLNYQGEVADVLVFLGRPHTDALGLVDSVEVSLTGGGILTRTITDALGLSDPIDQASASQRSATDPLGFLDSIAADVAKAITDALGLTDSVSVQINHKRTVTDVVGLVDAISVQLSGIGNARTVVDTLGITDQVLRAGTIRVTVTDSIGLTDSVARRFALAIADALAITDPVTQMAGLHRALTDVLGLTDVVVAVNLGEAHPGRIPLEGTHDPRIDLTGKHSPQKALAGKHAPRKALVGNSALE